MTDNATPTREQRGLVRVECRECGWPIFRWPASVDRLCVACARAVYGDPDGEPCEVIDDA